MLEYLKTYITEETINDFQKAEVFLNIFFSFVDIVIIIISIILFYSELKHFYLMVYQLIGIFLIDIIIRLYNIYKIKIITTDIFYKEIISCFISTYLFFLLLSLFKEILKELNFKEVFNITYPCLFYIIFSFSYENIISYYLIIFYKYVN